MATANSVITKIQGLITSANAATGEDSGNLTDAVAALIAGFGTPGNTSSLTVHTGTYMTNDRTGENIVFSTPGGVSYFCMFMKDIATTGTGFAYFTALVANKETQFVYIASSNTVGTLSSAANAYPTGEPTVNYYPGIDFGEDTVTFIAFQPLSSYCKVPQPGKTYMWIAW